VNRSRLHRAVKSAAKSFEDEKYSYVAVSRDPVEPDRARVIRHPQHRKGYVVLTLCTRSGLQNLTYSRRKAGDLYRAARSVRWGQAWHDPEL
jgi:ribosomal protein RSM22 (predicted rRNA methylase)